MPDDLDSPQAGEVLHLWRLMSVAFGPGAVSVYVCELHPGEELRCPPADEPEEC